MEDTSMLGWTDEERLQTQFQHIKQITWLHRQGLKVFLHLTLAPCLGNKIWNVLKLKTLLLLEKNTRSPHGLHMVCPHLIAAARWYHLAQLRTFRACTISSWSGGIIQNWTEEGLPLPRSHLEPPCYLRMAYVVAWPSFLTCGFTALGGWRKGKMLDKNCRCSPWGAQLDKHLHSIL